jgi:hypothetical protein
MVGPGRGKHGGGTAAAWVDYRVRVRRSVLEMVRDVVAIVRDVVIIALVVAALTAGVSAVQRLRDAYPSDPGLLPCATPTHDQYGTFCPTTPGGG